MAGYEYILGVKTVWDGAALNAGIEETGALLDGLRGSIASIGGAGISSLIPALAQTAALLDSVADRMDAAARNAGTITAGKSLTPVRPSEQIAGALTAAGTPLAELGAYRAALSGATTALTSGSAETQAAVRANAASLAKQIASGEALSSANIALVAGVSDAAANLKAQAASAAAAIESTGGYTSAGVEAAEALRAVAANALKQIASGEDVVAANAVLASAETELAALKAAHAANLTGASGVITAGRNVNQPAIVTADNGAKLDVLLGETGRAATVLRSSFDLYDQAIQQGAAAQAELTAATLGQVVYHGTQNLLERPLPGGKASSYNELGPGFYVSPEADTANAHAIGGGLVPGAGIYQGILPDSVKLLDLSKKLPADVVRIFEEANAALNTPDVSTFRTRTPEDEVKTLFSRYPVGGEAPIIEQLKGLGYGGIAGTQSGGGKQYNVFDSASVLSPAQAAEAEAKLLTTTEALSVAQEELVTLYHGTTQARIPGVLSQGLLPGGEPAGEGVVFGTTDPRIALNNARLRALDEDSNPGIVSFPKPENAVPIPGSAVGFTIPESIPAAEITRENVRTIAKSLGVNLNQPIGELASEGGAGGRVPPALPPAAPPAGEDPEDEARRAAAQAAADAAREEATVTASVTADLSQYGAAIQAAIIELRAARAATETPGQLRVVSEQAAAVDAEARRQGLDHLPLPSEQIAATIPIPRERQNFLTGVKAVQDLISTQGDAAAPLEYQHAANSLGSGGNFNPSGASQRAYDQATEDATAARIRTAAEDSKKAAEAAEELAANQGYIDGVVRLRSAQQRASAQIEEGLAGTRIDPETGIVSKETIDASKQYIDSLARTRVAQEQILVKLKERELEEGELVPLMEQAKAAQAAINAQTEALLAANGEYIASLVSSKESKAQEKAGVEAALAADQEYAASTLTAATARKTQAANVEEQRLVGRGVIQAPLQGPVNLETGQSVNAGFQEADNAAAAKVVANREKLVALLADQALAAQEVLDSTTADAATQAKALALKTASVTAEQAVLDGELTDADVQTQINVVQRERALALKEATAASQRAAYQSLVDSGAGPDQIGTRTQQFLAGISSRQTGNFVDPLSKPELGQFLSQKLATTAGFAVTGLATFAIFGELQKMITGSKALELALAGVKAQFDSLGDSAGFSQFRDGIKGIAADTGIAADQIATVAVQFKGALGAGAGGTLDDTQVLAQVQAAADFAKITNTTLSTVGPQLLEISKTYGDSITSISDGTIALSQSTGTAAADIVSGLSQIAPIADQVGLSVAKTAAIIAVAVETSGHAPTAITQSIARVASSTEANAGKIAAFFQQEAPAEAPTVVTALGEGQTGVVLDQIGKIYSTLSSGQKADINALLGRPRDIQDVVGFLNNYNQVLSDTKKYQDSSGTSARALSDVMNTLSAQVARIQAAFGQFGQVILQLGLSDALQKGAEALGTIVESVGGLLSLFGNLNDLTDGWLARILEAAVALRIAVALGGIVTSEGVGSAAAGAASSIPIVGGIVGKLLGKGAGKAAADTGTTDAAIAEQYGLDASLLATTAPETIGLLAKLGAVFTALGTALTSIVIPVGLVIATADAINKSLNTYHVASAARNADLRGIDTAFSKEGADGPDVQKAIDKYNKDRNDAIIRSPNYGAGDLKGPGAVVSTVEDLRKAEQKGAPGVGGPGGIVESALHELPYLFGKQTPGERLDSDVRKQTTSQFSQAVDQTLSPEQLSQALDAYNNSVPKADRLSKEELAKLAKSGTDNKTKFDAIVKFYVDAAGFNKNLGKNLQDVKDGQKNVSAKAAEAAGGLGYVDPVIAEAEFSQGTINSSQLVANLTETVRGDQSTLNSDLNPANGKLDSTAIDAAAKQLSTDQQTISTFYKTQFDAITAAAKTSSSALGLNPLQTAQADSAVALSTLLSQPTSGPANQLGDPNQVAEIQQYITDRQTILTNAIQGSTNLQQALSLAKGEKLPSQLSLSLNLATVKGLGAPLGDAIKTFANGANAGYNAFETDLAKAMSGGTAAIKAFIIENIANIIGLENQAILEGKDISKYAAALNAATGLLKTLPFIPTVGGHVVPQAVTPSTGFQNQQANDAAAAAAAANDPLAAAQAARQTAADNYNHVLQQFKVHQATQADVTNAYAGLVSAGQGVTAAQNNIQQGAVAILQASAGNDAFAKAAADMQAAQLQYSQALANHDVYGEEQGQAAIIAAQIEGQQAQVQLVTAQGAVTTALANGNPLATAKAALATANAEAAIAHGPIDQLNALAAQITAKNQIADAITGLMDAQFGLLEAIATAAGHTVEAAQIGLKQARYDLAREIAKDVANGTPLSQDPTIAADQTKIVQQQAAVRDAAFQNNIDSINFLLSTNKISDGNAIAQLQTLDQNTKLTLAEHRQIEQQIYSLQQSLQQNLQFNLPSDIALPTLYEARRFDQSGGGSHYNDNRVINVNISTNAKLEPKDITTAVTNAIAAPPRFGSRARTY